MDTVSRRTEDCPDRQYAAGVLAESERHAWRVCFAELRRRPEHLSDVCRAWRLRRRPGAGAREAECNREVGETRKLRGALAPDAQGKGRPGRRANRFLARRSVFVPH